MSAGAASLLKMEKMTKRFGGVVAVRPSVFRLNPDCGQVRAHLLQIGSGYGDMVDGQISGRE